MDTDRNLLFAVLTLQAGLIDRDRFVQACTLWTTRKDVSIGDLLEAQGWLTVQARSLVEQLLAVNLRQHGDDSHASLAAAAGVEARGALASVADADVERSLAALPAGRTNPERIAFAAEDFSTVPPVECAGHNLLYEEIGRGGIGRVLRGRDPELRRDLAVKVLRDEYRDDATAQRRFLEEAQIGGQLQHPGLVPVYELGRFADRRPYFTMKLVKGRTLSDLLKERPDARHDQARFLTIFEQLCQTVAYAHSKGVIHRDLKPSNIMVGAFGEVQVMDWGLAKVLNTRSGADPEATTAGTLIRTVRSDSATAEDGRTGVVGTPAYMAPEQARGEVEGVDERADVFGLGAILCVILAGQPPFSEADREAVLRQAAAGDLAEAFARLEGCGADAELLMLCRVCLAQRRDDRPRHAGEVAARMAAYQAAVQERLRKAELERVAAEARAVEERKRRRLALSLAAAVLALVALGTGGGLWVQHQAAERRADQSRREAEQREVAEFALGKAVGLRQQARWKEAAAVLEQALRSLGDAGPDDLRQRLNVAHGEVVLVTRLDDIRQRRATLLAGRNFDLKATAGDCARAFREAGLGEVGEDPDAVAARVRASEISGPLVAALDDWAFVAGMTPDRKTAEWALAVARRADPDPWRDRFRDLAVWRDRKALQALADEALREQGDQLDTLSPRLLAALGSLMFNFGADPVPLLRAAQRRYPNDFWLNLELSRALGMKQDEEALAYSLVAVALRPDASAPYVNLAAGLADKKDLDGAAAALKKSIALDPKDASAHAMLAMILETKKDGPGAIEEYLKAITIAPDFAEAHCNLGRAFLSQGRFPEALESLRHGNKLGMRRRDWGYPSPEWVSLAERLVDLEGRLPALLAGESEPADAAESAALSQLCHYKRLYGAAARFSADAFAADPKIATDLRQQHRYSAACHAALAVAGEGADAKYLPDKVRLTLRRQALAWLRADLALYAKLVESEEPAAKQTVRQRLAHWQKDDDLVAVRGKAALDRLPDNERMEWRRLWDEVAVLLEKVEEKK
jgi:serine/threonine-protein kinase